MVKRNIANYLENILLTGILFLSWGWSRSNKRGINVRAVHTSGYRARVQWESLKFAPSVSLLTGTSRVHINSKRGHDLSKGLTEQGGGERGIRTLGSLLRLADSSRSLVLQTSALSHSAISPLNGHGNGSRTRVSGVGFRRPGPLDDAVVYGAGGKGVSKRLTSHPHCNNRLFLPFCLNLPSRTLWMASQVLRQDTEYKHIASCIPFRRERSGLRPIIFNEIQESDSTEARAAFAFRPISFERIGCIIFLFGSPNANPVRGFIPEQIYKTSIGFGQEFSGTTIQADSTECGYAHLWCTGTHVFACIYFKPHRFPLSRTESGLCRNRSTETEISTNDYLEMPEVSIIGQEMGFLGRKPVPLAI